MPRRCSCRASCCLAPFHGSRYVKMLSGAVDPALGRTALSNDLSPSEDRRMEADSPSYKARLREALHALFASNRCHPSLHRAAGAIGSHTQTLPNQPPRRPHEQTSKSASTRRMHPLQRRPHSGHIRRPLRRRQYGACRPHTVELPPFSARSYKPDGFA